MGETYLADEVRGGRTATEEFDELVALPLTKCTAEEILRQLERRQRTDDDYDPLGPDRRLCTTRVVEDDDERCPDDLSEGRDEVVSDPPAESEEFRGQPQHFIEDLPYASD